MVIAEDVDDITSDDVVYCEGTCATWLHRKCISLSETMYDKLSESEDPYFCPNCVISKQSGEIAKP